MTKYDWIGLNMLFIKEGIMLGIISTCTLSHFRIYTHLLNYMAAGKHLREAIFILANENKISEQSVYRIKWEMESEV